MSFEYKVSIFNRGQRKLFLSDPAVSAMNPQNEDMFNNKS